jgi:outer membrane lipoprotein-sorting protein
MKLLRTLSTTRLVALAATVVALLGVVAAVAVGASGGGGDTPPPKALANAVHDALTAPPVDGVTARVTFTNRLFPSGALLGNAGPVLMSGGSGRLWMTNDGRGRIELQSGDGDAQIVWTPTGLTVYDASSNTAYEATLPASVPESGATETPPSLARITDVLTQLGAHATVSGAQPTNVAATPAYSAAVSPKHDGGLLGSVELAWDAAQGVPLRVAVYAQDATEPVLELSASQISYGPVDATAVDVKPPSDAKVVDLGQLHPGGGVQQNAALTGLADVKAAAGFPVTAPATLVGLPRQDVRLVGDAESQTVVVTYGQGLGAILVVERKTSADGRSGGPRQSLPTVSLDGVSAHELATQLGTIVAWEQNGVSTTIAGSIPTAAAEAAARELR